MQKSMGSWKMIIFFCTCLFSDGLYHSITHRDRGLSYTDHTSEEGVLQDHYKLSWFTELEDLGLPLSDVKCQ